MSQKHTLIAILVCAVFLAMPFMVTEMSGVASAGLSLGFTAPLDYISHVVLILCVGVFSAMLPREAVWLVPLASVSMVLAAACVTLIAELMQEAFMWLLASVLVFGLTCGISRHKVVLFAVLCSGSLGFHMGMHYAANLPSIVAPLFYVAGIIGAVAMMFIIAVSFGITLVGDHAHVSRRITGFLEKRLS
jgi:urease accessory protein